MVFLSIVAPKGGNEDSISLICNHLKLGAPNGHHIYIKSVFLRQYLFTLQTQSILQQEVEDGGGESQTKRVISFRTLSAFIVD